MALPPTAPKFISVPVADAPAPVAAVSGAKADLAPLDLVILTCDFDWNENTHTLCDAAVGAGVRAEVICFENLEGETLGDRLSRLHETMGEWLASGKIQPSTIVYVDLHGGPVGEFDGMGDFYDARPDLKAFHDSLLDEPEGKPATDNRSSLFAFSAAGVEIPGFMLDSALRHSTQSNGKIQSDFKGLIVWSACHARHMAPDLMNSGGENLLLAGNKPVLSGDSEDCMLEMIALIGSHKREGRTPLSGREYWMHLRNVSGEHIAYVQDNSVEISKVLEFGHSEPVLGQQSSRASEQARRVLEAKLSHGSAKALQAVFDKYGKDQFSDLRSHDLFAVLALDDQASDDELRKKIDILGQNGFGLPNDIDGAKAYLDCCVRTENIGLLSAWLQSLILQSQGRLLVDAIDAFTSPDDDELKRDLRELLAEHPGIARPWLELSLQARPPEVRLAIERYLKSSVDDESRTAIEANFCVASGAVCLLNLIYNAFERDKDLREADALMPAALALPSPSGVRSYLNVLLQESLNQAGRGDLLRILDQHGITEVDEANYRESVAYFSYKLPWLT